MSHPKIILGIETSCDETAAAVLQKDKDGIHILSNMVASSAKLQAKYGGVIPEQAAREQIKSIIPAIEEALNEAKITYRNLDAIAVTYGPGLIGSLLIGTETAKTLSLVWDKPLIPINHLIGHFYANWINSPQPTFPCIGLLISGGHTDLVLFESHGKYKYLGGTRDDAAGECFDKCARLLGLPYPGGPTIAAEAAKFKDQKPVPGEDEGSKIKIELPRPLLYEKSFDFSFSGLKTAVSREVNKLKAIKQFNNETITQLAYEIQAAIVDVLVTKTVKAAQVHKIDQIIVAGGVSANQNLVSQLKKSILQNLPSGVSLHVPPPELCTDNAAMIAAAAFFLPRGKEGQKLIEDPLTIQANPGLSL